MSYTVKVTRNTRTFRFRNSGSELSNCGYLVSAHGALQIAEIVLGAACVGVIGYYGNEYYYDVGAQAAEFFSLIVKTFDLDIWKPVVFFMLVSTAFLLNSLCLFCASALSSETASAVGSSLYGMLYHFIAFSLYLAASIVLMVSLDKRDVKRYKDGFYYEPFMAAGIIGIIASGFYLLHAALCIWSFRTRRLN